MPDRRKIRLAPVLVARERALRTNPDLKIADSPLAFPPPVDAAPIGRSPDLDRRAGGRSAVHLRANVILPYNEEFQVVVVDLSEGGCQIRFVKPVELPQRFHLEFRNLVYVCERRWTKDLSVGVQFLDLCSRARRRELSMHKEARAIGAHPPGQDLDDLPVRRILQSADSTRPRAHGAPAVATNAASGMTHATRSGRFTSNSSPPAKNASVDRGLEHRAVVAASPGRG